jgi:D-alanyl-D-alanine carboxypeptidase (penicillin-binding protein 5/6)
LPVFAQVVGQAQATIPVAGVIKNLDTLLGRDGVVGIKTGHTDQAGGCFVVGANLSADGQSVRIYGAVMGQPNALAGALAATDPLLRAIEPALHVRVLVKPHDAVAQYETAWNETGTIVAQDPVSWVLIDGTPISRRVTLMKLPPVLPAGSRVGTLIVDAGVHHAEVRLLTTTAIIGPSLGWRLSRPF